VELRLRSPAKVNLGLRIVERRPDGYHSIETALQMVSLADEIVLRLSEGPITCSVQGAELPTDQENLAVRAAYALRRLSGTQAGVHISLTKRIPVGAGLGGGSGNAAAVLLGLMKLWALDLSHQRLLELGASLGSDVPFFLTAASAWAEGRGEVLTPLPPMEGMAFVLATPPFRVSTEWAYPRVTFGLTRAEKALSILRLLLEKKRFTEVGPYLHNDFEPLIERAYPEIGVIRAEMLEQGALGVALSGSGPTVFGLFPDAAWAARVDLGRPSWTISVAEPVRDWPGVFFPKKTARDIGARPGNRPDP
jgi:4-diphosphocytidyl-2-C-methyl-D-erythritol kinase